MKRWLNALGDLLFPPVCVHCGGLVEGGDYCHLCSDCGARIEFVHPPACDVCGHPFPDAVLGGSYCRHCADLAPAFGHSRSAVLLRGPARSLLLELKYRAGHYVLADMTAIFRRSPGLLAHVRGSVLVPVPLHPRKRRERGFNQSDLLARALANAAGLAKPKLLLKRKIDTPSQTVLDGAERRANLKNAFALTPGGDLNPRQRYVLVDDVFTSGSTLNSCALALRQAGCLSLDVATFAHG